MDFFDTDKIEGKVKEVNEQNLHGLLNSKKLENKQQALEYLDSSTSIKHFREVVKLANYPIKQISEQAYKLILKWMPGKEPESDVDRDTFDVLIKKVMPWVNELANAAMQDSQDAPEPSVDIDNLNLQICECLDFIAEHLDRDVINIVLSGGLKFNNFKVQIAACQVVKHFYLSVQDKTIIELSDIFDTLIANNTVGTKDLKRHSIECMMAIYRVFGSAVDGFIEQLGSLDKIELIKQGAAKLKLRQPKIPIRQSVVQTSVKTSAVSSAVHGGRATSSSRRISDSNNKAEPAQPISSFGFDNTSQINFDLYKNEPGSDILLMYDDKWCKKVQIMKKEDQIVDELTDLHQALERSHKNLYYPDLNKGLLLQLKNYLLDSHKKIVSLTISILRSLIKSTARNLQDGFALFYPEIIENLKSKSKQDGELLESLVWMASNVPLATYLKKIQRDLSEKSSILRGNLIEVLVTVLQNKENFEVSERSKASPILLDLIRFAEVELSKDVSVSVRKSSERIIKVIRDNWSSEIQFPGNQAHASEVSTGRRSVIGTSNGPNRNSAIPISIDKGRPSERASLTKTPSGTNLIAQSTVNTGLQASRSSINLKQSGSSSKLNTQMNMAPPPGRPSLIRADTKEKAQLLQSTNMDSKLSYRSTLVNPLLHHQKEEKHLLSIGEINEGTDFGIGMASLEKMAFERKDTLNKHKVSEAFEILAAKATKENDTDRLFTQLCRVKDDIDPASLVSIVLALSNSNTYFSPSLLRTFMPVFLKFSEMNLKSSGSTVARRTAVGGKEASNNQVHSQLMDKLISFYGPLYFFEVFEEALYAKELFSSKEADALLIMFESLLVKIPSNLHPVNLVLSIVRGFIYFHSSLSVNSGLNELVFVLMNVYGKDNFKYIKKEFEMVGLREKVVDLKQWTQITEFVNPEAHEKLAKTNFKDKILSEVKELTPFFKQFLTNSNKGDLASMKELLQTCTRNFIYIISEKENLKVVDFLAEKMVDANIQIQKVAVQVLALHFISAKTTFKFSQLFFNNFWVMLKHKNADIRALSLNCAFYITKQEPKVFKLLVAGLSENSEDVKQDVAGVVLKLITLDKKFIKSFELSTSMESLSSLLMSKRQILRVEGEKLLQLLLGHFDKKDFVALINKLPQQNRKPLTEILERVSEGRITSLTSSPDLNVPTKPNPKSPESPNRSEDEQCVVRNLQGMSDEIAKCKTIREIKMHAEKHLAPEIASALFDVNTKKVLEGLRLLGEGLTKNVELASQFFVFVAKLLNLLIEAETKQNEISTATAELQSTLIKVRRNTSAPIAKQEKWGLCEFLMILFKTKFDKKFMAAATKLVLSIFQTNEEKSSFASLVEKCDKKLYEAYLSSYKTSGQSTESGTGDSQIVQQYRRQTTNERTEKVDEQYDFASPMLEDEDMNDPNFAALKNAIADESSIKYDPEMKDSGSPIMGIPSPVKKTGADHIGKRLMSLSSEEEEEKQVDDKESPVFASQHIVEPMPDESPVFGKSIAMDNSIRSPQANHSLQLTLHKAQTPTKEHTGFQSIIGRGITSPRDKPPIGPGLKPTVALVNRSADLNVNIKKASTGDQQRSEEHSMTGSSKFGRTGSKSGIDASRSKPSLIKPLQSKSTLLTTQSKSLKKTSLDRLLMLLSS